MAAERTARVLSFMDGLSSCCSEERVMVFTMSGGKDGVDPTVLPAELGEIMLAYRGSPSRALRTVINALQHVASAPPPAQSQQRASTTARPPRLASRWSGHLDYASTAVPESSGASQSSPQAGGGGGGGFANAKDVGVVPVDDSSAASQNGRGSEASSDKDRPVTS